MGRIPAKANLSGHREPGFCFHENTVSITMQFSLVTSQPSSLARNTEREGREGCAGTTLANRDLGAAHPVYLLL